MGRKTKLTLELQKEIVDRIKVGAFPWVAAQSCHVPPSTFYRWMASGEKDASSRYREFWEEVRAAAAYARMLAEAEVRKGAAFQWLRYGPGRERPGEPGWTNSAQVDVTSGGKTLEDTLRAVLDEPDRSRTAAS